MKTGINKVPKTKSVNESVVIEKMKISEHMDALNSIYRNGNTKNTIYNCVGHTIAAYGKRRFVTILNRLDGKFDLVYNGKLIETEAIAIKELKMYDGKPLYSLAKSSDLLRDEIRINGETIIDGNIYTIRSDVSVNTNNGNGKSWSAIIFDKDTQKTSLVINGKKFEIDGLARILDTFDCDLGKEAIVRYKIAGSGKKFLYSTKVGPLEYTGSSLGIIPFASGKWASIDVNNTLIESRDKKTIKIPTELQDYFSGSQDRMNSTKNHKWISFDNFLGGSAIVLKNMKDKLDLDYPKICLTENLTIVRQLGKNKIEYLNEKNEWIKLILSEDGNRITIGGIKYKKSIVKGLHTTKLFQ